MRKWNFYQKFRSHNTTTPLTNTNGQAIATNNRVSSGVRRSSSNNAIRSVKQSVMEQKAPIAQAECSDTDYDTARSVYRPVSIDKPKTTDTVIIENRQPRGWCLLICWNLGQVISFLNCIWYNNFWKQTWNKICEITRNEKSITILNLITFISELNTHNVR